MERNGFRHYTARADLTTIGDKAVQSPPTNKNAPATKAGAEARGVEARPARLDDVAFRSDPLQGGTGPD